MDGVCVTVRAEPENGSVCKHEDAVDGVLRNASARPYKLRLDPGRVLPPPALPQPSTRLLPTFRRHPISVLPMDGMLSPLQRARYRHLTLISQSRPVNTFTSIKVHQLRIHLYRYSRIHHIRKHKLQSTPSPHHTDIPGRWLLRSGCLHRLRGENESRVAFELLNVADVSPLVTQVAMSAIFSTYHKAPYVDIPSVSAEGEDTVPGPVDLVSGARKITSVLRFLSCSHIHDSLTRWFQVPWCQARSANAPSRRRARPSRRTNGQCGT